ncbi:MAG: glycosyltransferase family 2 protein [Lachnospiraceae bacterium]|jgi:glycosyltransferase involved in cell wall biosynthesis|nr:glycosyltransferase family 2 protein [Lachnospiraceae bacterium]
MEAMKKERVTIVVPCYNEQGDIPTFLEEIHPIMSKLTDYQFKVLFIDDGSQDKTLRVLREMTRRDKRIEYITFSRHFGKEASLYAGFANSDGDYIALMSLNMKEPRNLLPKMLKILSSGLYDCVATKISRKDDEINNKNVYSKLSNMIIGQISENELVEDAMDFRIMRRQMVQAILALGEYDRFSKSIYDWVGFRTYWLSYEEHMTETTSSKWNLNSFVKYTLDNVVNFSYAPLTLAFWCGIIFTVISFLVLIVCIVWELIATNPVTGWIPIICIITFIGSIQLFCLGILGQYLSRIFREIKKRPHYIVGETNKDGVLLTK